MPPDPYRYFRIEARELVEQLGKATLALEAAAEGSELTQQLLRLAHTLKGAARVVRQRETADDAHAIEDLLAPHRQATGPVPHEVVEAILRRVDAIGARTATLAPVVPSEPLPGKPMAEEPPRTLHADVAEVDALLESLAEIHAQLGALKVLRERAQRARDLGGLLADQLASPGGARPEGRLGAVKAASMAEELRGLTGSLEAALGIAIDQTSRELGQARDAAEHLRLVPAGSLFNSLERTVRDGAQSLGKRAQFEGRGGEVRIDGHVLGVVQAALLQVVRNSIAHGLETETERVALGKRPVGTVAVEIARSGRRVVFRCRDDGRGVDVEAVRRAAVTRGLPALEAERLGPQEIFQLLLRGGISTSTSVTEVSGRGIGLDVVREAIERLGGEVRVQTRRGEWTEFELRVPLSVAAIEGLSVEAAGLIATVPLDAVRRTIRVQHEDVSRTAEGDSLVFEGNVIPFVRLSTALRADAEPSPRSTGAAPAIVVEADGRLAALGVDRLLGTTDVVVRPLPDLALADAIVAGASLDAEGNPRMVLDPAGILAAAARAVGAASKTEAQRRCVLVVDDSLTTRMLEQSILESAGYDVDLATSGEDGLQMARRKTYALFLVDVEMPGIDGFAFIETARADPSLRDVPAILVTSRASAEDLEKGRRVGAQGHIVKSEFDQTDLLARIKRLAG